MANIVFWIENNGVQVNAGDSTKIDLHGQVIGDAGSGDTHSFAAEGVSMSALASTINAAVRDAAIAQFESDESPLTVGALDRKTFIGGVVGL